MKAYLFPGQGAQFEGMAKDLYTNSVEAKKYFEKANEILGFRISDIMIDGTAEALKQTKVTQPAVFLHSIISYMTFAEDIKPDMVAGHSLGELTALVAAKVMSFEDGLALVSKRALAMQRACEAAESTMAAILGLEDEQIEEICNAIDDIVVPANYNCPGQLVISGSIKGIELATERMKEAGAKRALVLPVSGAFHSPFMEPAQIEFGEAVKLLQFNPPICPVYQNVTAKGVTDAEEIKQNIIDQICAPVKWTQTMKQMLADGVKEFVEVGGNGKVLTGFVKKIDRMLQVEQI